MTDMRLYLDATVTIYLVERTPSFCLQVLAKTTDPGVDLVVSDLTRMECLVKPLKTADTTTLGEFDKFFRTVEVVGLPGSAFDRAADLRARFGKLKTPDALHLAAAIEAGCDAVLTNDSDFTTCTDIRIELI